MAPNSVQHMLAEARKQLEHITAQDAVPLTDDDFTLFIDVRDRHERAQSGAIAGSVHVPRGHLEFMADPSAPMHEPALSSGKQLIVYCATGGRSMLAAKTLSDMGLENVVNLVGGFNAWAEAGGAIEHGK